jgi:hypothetical protein
VSNERDFPNSGTLFPADYKLGSNATTAALLTWAV